MYLLTIVHFTAIRQIYKEASGHCDSCYTHALFGTGLHGYKTNYTGDHFVLSYAEVTAVEQNYGIAH